MRGKCMSHLRSYIQSNIYRTTDLGAQQQSRDHFLHEASLKRISFC